jgi:hypothetical protein
VDFLRKIFLLGLLAVAIVLVCGAIPGLMHLGAMSNDEVAGLPPWAIQKRDVWQRDFGLYRASHTEEETVIHVADAIRTDHTVRSVSRVDKHTASLYPSARLGVTFRPAQHVPRPLIVSNPDEMQRAA